MPKRLLALLLVSVIYIAVHVGLVPVASAEVKLPGSPVTCADATHKTETGTVKALPGGRKMMLSQSKGAGYLPTSRTAVTRVYSAKKELLWSVDSRSDAPQVLGTVAFNKDQQGLRSGSWLVTTFKWRMTGGKGRMCNAYSRIP